jgi:hypothetical protein
MRGFEGLGTFQHFDHLLLANEAYWKVSMGRMLCRLLAPPQRAPPLAGVDLIHYWEAMPLVSPSFPGGVKFLIAAFPALFGTPAGTRLQRWCSRQRWALVWSLGLNFGATRTDFWTVGYLGMSIPSRERLADPLVLRTTSAAANLSLDHAADSTFEYAWGEVAALRSRYGTYISNTTWAEAWQRLTSSLPGTLRLSQLRAGDCGDVDRCLGTTSNGDCFCYEHDEWPSADLVV